MGSANGLGWFAMEPNHMAERSIAGLKTKLVADEGIGTDIPNVMLTTRGHQLIDTHLLAGETTAAAGLMACAILLSDADRVFFGFDVYYELDPDAHPLPGDLGRRFAAGDPAVCEAIHITCVPEHGPPLSIFRTYHYEGRVVVWDDRIEMAGRGPYARSASYAFEQRRHSPLPPALIRPGNKVELLGEAPGPHGELGLLFALSLGCPCGSNRATGDCCAVRN